jgi:hypothetical protein
VFVIELMSALLSELQLVRRDFLSLQSVLWRVSQDATKKRGDLTEWQKEAVHRMESYRKHLPRTSLPLLPQAVLVGVLTHTANALAESWHGQNLVEHEPSPPSPSSSSAVSS